MKILFLSKSSRPERGYRAGRLALELSRELELLGHRVHVVSSDAKSTSPAYPFFAYHPDLDDVLANIPLSTHVVELTESAGPFDAIHAFGWNAGLSAALLRRVRGAPLVFTPCLRESKEDSSDPWFRWASEMEAWLGERSDRVLRMSAFEVRPESLPLGVRIADFEAETDLPAFRELFAPPDARLLAHAGSLQMGAGWERLIDTLSRSEFQKVHLAVAGDGAGRTWLEELIRARGLDKRVFFAGPLSTIVLGAFYRVADAFVEPHDDGPGLAALEAASLGRHVLWLGKGGVPAEDALRGLSKPNTLPARPPTPAWSDIARKLVSVYESLMNRPIAQVSS